MPENRPNPYGSNGTTSDPREQLCWDIYIEKLSKGIENAYQSAVEAGYSQSHAENITLQGWFKERFQQLERKEMLSKAEKILSKTLSYKTETEEGEVNTDLLRVQVDVSKHLTKTLGKEAYSERTELTGRDGGAITIDTATKEKIDEEIKRVINGYTGNN